MFEREEDFKMKTASSEPPPESLGEHLGFFTRFRDGDFELGGSLRQRKRAPKGALVKFAPGVASGER
jgi:hypothetical protein